MIGFKLESKISIDDTKFLDFLFDCGLVLYQVILPILFPLFSYMYKSTTYYVCITLMVLYACFALFKAITYTYYISIFSLHELGYTENKELWLNAVLNGEIPYIVGNAVAPIDERDKDIQTTNIEITGEEYITIKSKVNKALHEKHMKTVEDAMLASTRTVNDRIFLK